MNRIKLRNNETGDETTKSIVNWNHLDKGSKEKYTVLDGNSEAGKTPLKRFTPPELEENKPEVKTDETKTSGNGEGDAKAAADDDSKGNNPEGADENAQKEGEEQTDYILRLAGKGLKDTEIAKIAGIHFQKVKSIIAKTSGNGEGNK